MFKADLGTNRLIVDSLTPHAFSLILVALTLSANVVPIAAFRPSVAPSRSGVDWSQVNVVTIYQLFSGDTLPVNLADFTGILAETATDLVWHALYLSPSDHAPSATLSAFTEEIKYVKARLPWVLFQGVVDAYDYCAQTPDPGIVYSTSHDYWAGYPGCYALDIAKPKGTQVVIQFAEYLVDAGVDLLHFDCVNCLPGAYNLDRGPYINAWKQIASFVKDYARNRYGKDIPVTINNAGLLFGGVVFPDQDYLDLALAGEETTRMVKAESFSIPWGQIKSAIMRTYRHLPPTIIFLDTGGPNDPMPAFASLPKSEQIKELTMLHSIALKEGAHFAYPLYGLGEIPYGQNFNVEGQYDAIRHGTYDTIKQLANSISTITSRSDWPTVRQALVNLTSAQNAGLVSDKAKSLLENASFAYNQTVQAFMNHDSSTVQQQALRVFQIIDSAYQADRDYHSAVMALANASEAIQTAQKENRTNGLADARQLLSLAHKADDAWNYSGAAQLAVQAQNTADMATLPTTGKVTQVPEVPILLDVGLVGIGLFLVAALILHRRRKTNRT